MKKRLSLSKGQIEDINSYLDEELASFHNSTYQNSANNSYSVTNPKKSIHMVVPELQKSPQFTFLGSKREKTHSMNAETSKLRNIYSSMAHNPINQPMLLNSTSYSLSSEKKSSKRNKKRRKKTKKIKKVKSQIQKLQKTIDSLTGNKSNDSSSSHSRESKIGIRGMKSGKNNNQNQKSDGLLRLENKISLLQNMITENLLDKKKSSRKRIPTKRSLNAKSLASKKSRQITRNYSFRGQNKFDTSYKNLDNDTTFTTPFVLERKFKKSRRFKNFGIVNEKKNYREKFEREKSKMKGKLDKSGFRIKKQKMRITRLKMKIKNMKELIEEMNDQNLDYNELKNNFDNLKKKYEKSEKMRAEQEIIIKGLKAEVRRMTLNNKKKKLKKKSLRRR